MSQEAANAAERAWITHLGCRAPSGYNLDVGGDAVRGPRAMIPRALHVVWVGPDPSPDACLDSWRRMHPDWAFTLWRDHTAGWSNSEQIARRAARGDWCGVADVMRYEILVRCGGIALDADSTCERPLDDRFLTPSAWACYENETARPGLVGNSAMGAECGSLFFAACAAACAHADVGAPAWKSVGPILLTRVARETQGLTVLPARHFYPHHHTGVVAPGDAPVFAEQQWATTRAAVVAGPHLTQERAKRYRRRGLIA